VRSESGFIGKPETPETHCRSASRRLPFVFRALRVFRVLRAAVLAIPASLVLAAGASGAPEIVALETEWINMGLMAPGAVNRERVEVDRRAREIRYVILINGEEKRAEPRVYPLDAVACEDFFVFLEKQRPARWKDDYSVPMLDGWAWRLRVRYGDAREKRVEGNETPPPGGGEIQRRIRALAPFESDPRIF
jgi:hypothetical protein